ncbi:MAG: FAD-binding oxidoreductase [Rhodospirillales bacterium]|nr:FAD-binding oxidoreductase [Rhodospirillales bacterium]
MSLQTLLGSDGYLTQAADTAKYRHDIVGDIQGDPRGVARPTTTEEVSQIMAWCHANKVSVIPQGGNTGLCGGCIPQGQPDTLILSLERMNKVRNLDIMGNTITVDAGCVLADVQRIALENNRFFPVSHGGQGSAQIGGNLSTNSGGNNVLKYGTTRAQVLGLEVVLPDGQIWNGLRALHKDTAGMDLKQIFIGAEGTLGIITAAVLKLRPKPVSRETAMVAIREPADGLWLLRKLQDYVGETVSSFELMHKNAIDTFIAFRPQARVPFTESHPYLVIMEAESPSRFFDLRGAFEAALADAFEEGKAIDAVIAEADQHRLDFWAIREGMAVAMVEDDSCLKSDTSVPVHAIADFVTKTTAEFERLVPGIRPSPLGHIGDGNIHFNGQRPFDMDKQTFISHWDALKDAVENISVELGGSVCAEHGVGRIKKKAVARAKSKEEMALFHTLKNALDPDGICNPGAVL